MSGDAAATNHNDSRGGVRYNRTCMQSAHGTHRSRTELSERAIDDYRLNLEGRWSEGASRRKHAHLTSRFLVDLDEWSRSRTIRMNYHIFHIIVRN